jgi:DNA-binding NarL/FixJ family response regulator
VLADDAVVIREGLARTLAEHGIDVTATVGTVDELLRCVASDPPDVAIIDIRMPPTHTTEGLVAAQQIRSTHPDVATLVLSQYIDVDYALRLMTGRFERVGYLLKDRIADAGALTAALDRVASGGVVIEPSLVDELVSAPSVRDPLATLTPREREVLALVGQGKTDRGIAEELVITPKTVEPHVRSIFAKLDLPTNASENPRVHAVLAFLGHAPSGRRLIQEPL